jgi:ATP-dependent DNA helicase DinG
MLTTGSMLQFFPLASPREKQAKAINFIERAINNGYKHIVIAAPTGTGKSAIGATACLWAAGAQTNLVGEAGGYYLVTQKMLQDQLERDFVGHPEYGCVSIKSAQSYECDNPKFKNCDVGRRHKCGCTQYNVIRSQFATSKIGVTNYPFYITERTHVGKLLNRKVLVLDECHNIERSLTRFFELTVGPEELEDVEVLEDIPEFDGIRDFLTWCTTKYQPRLLEKATSMTNLALESNGHEYIEKANKLILQLAKLDRAISSITKNIRGWVFWSQPCDKVQGTQYIARPLFAREFTGWLFDTADVVIHMSAFPGEKNSYCRDLGLDVEDVAWANFASTFPVENRPVHMLAVGSMGMRNIETSLPYAVNMVSKILDRHVNQKGLIHCNSYKVGQAIFDALARTEHFDRLIFPKTADERAAAFEKHSQSKVPTVIISPSMTEGFDFSGDLARFQVIAKCPYPSLGDKYVVARKDIDNVWYAMETVKTIIQASGRIVRSEVDKGITYILDSDIIRLIDDHRDLFPSWWLKALVYPKT